MLNKARLVKALRPVYERNAVAKRLLKAADQKVSVAYHSAASLVPSLIHPQPRQLTIAVTAHCNLRCKGCDYGQGSFMPGSQLDLDTLKAVIDDAAAAGMSTVRLYGGEPLLHKDLPAVVAHAVAKDMRCYVTSNGTHLRSKIDDLFAAGLRLVTIGFYGIGADYDTYTQRRDHYRRLRESLAYTRSRYGDELELQLNFVVMRSTGNRKALMDAWSFAREFDMHFHVDLVSYSVPFFTAGHDLGLTFDAAAEADLRDMTAALLDLKQQVPDRVPHSTAFIRSIPDWLLLKQDMRVPCDAYDMIWVGADGSVQLCDTDFPLGNVHETPLRDILFSDGHRAASRDAFLLKCANCNCKSDSRIQKHAPSLRRYRGEVARA